MTKRKLEWKENSNGCWEVTSHRPQSRGYIPITREGKPLLAHRYMYEKYHGTIPEGMHVLHKCDNPPCVNPAHLFIGTHLDNMRDRDQKGRRVDVRGEACGSAKLTAKQVQEIRARYIPGKIGGDRRDPNIRGNVQQLAKEYGICRKHVWNIAHRDWWKHVPNKEIA